MANSKLLLASISIVLMLVGVRSDASIEGGAAEADASGSALRLELDRLRSKISTLESSIEDRIREIKIKEDRIAHLNAVVIQEKLSSIASLESEIESLQEKGAVDAKTLSGKANARVGELEKQIVKIKSEIEAQSKMRNALDSRASEAEKQLQELDLRLGSLQKTNEEQKLRIRKTQRALELAEEELMKAQLEATSKFKELNEVHGAWLPPWLATHISRFQDLTVIHWNEHAKPALVLIMHKASEKMEAVQKWAEPHVDSAKTKWIPAAKEQLLGFKSNAEPYLQKIHTKSFEVYDASKDFFAPHIVKIQEVIYPYFQEARDFSKPYIDKAVIVTKPHIEKLRLVLKPYTKHVARTYRKSLRMAQTYHRQVQDNIHEKLKKHELTKPHATKELAWFLASALLAFPIFFLYRFLAAASCKKARKPRRTTRSSHAHRRPKRRHADK